MWHSSRARVIRVAGILGELLYKLRARYIVTSQSVYYKRYSIFLILFIVRIDYELSSPSSNPLAQGSERAFNHQECIADTIQDSLKSPIHVYINWR